VAGIVPCLAGKWTNEWPDGWHVARPSCADHLGGRGVGHVLAVGERRVLRAPAHPDRQQRSPPSPPQGSPTNPGGASPQFQAYLWLKTAPLGAVFGTLSTTPQPARLAALTECMEGICEKAAENGASGSCFLTSDLFWLLDL